MPRATKSTEHPWAPRTLVVDNGAYTIKAGFASESPDVETECFEIPNCIARSRERKTFVGAQLNCCDDFGEMVFRRPVEKGYIVNWEAERDIWEQSFMRKNAPLNCDPSETNLLLTEAPNSPTSLQTNCDQIVFEEFEFDAYYRCVGPSLNAYNDIASLVGDPPTTQPISTECMLVVDSGYSHSVVTPIVHGRSVQQAIRRLPIGGKFLTNYLKEIISIRQTNVIDETYIMNRVKEDVCFVSSDFRTDLDKTWKGQVGAHSKPSNHDIVVDYVLPDYIHHMKGIARPHDPRTAAMRNKYGAVPGPDGVMETIMTLGNERFAVPELLFHPGDVSMKDSGLPEAVMRSLSALPTGLWPAMLANVLLLGGNVKIPGFVDRMRTELRQLAPAECELRIAVPESPTKFTWLGGSRLACNPELVKERFVTRQEYLEHGANWLLKRFASTWTG
ncbi:Actin- protein 6 [Agyrium rufum]|nr:Actin- protein 6 [Agyrium rufum]